MWLMMQDRNFLVGIYNIELDLILVQQRGGGWILSGNFFGLLIACYMGLTMT
jgi:hypothetical protein